MNFSALANSLIPLIKKNKLIYNESETDKYKGILISLYKDILTANNYVQNSSISYKKDIISSTENKLKLPTSKYFPKVIREYIQHTSYSLLKYKLNLNSREITVCFYVFGEKQATDKIYRSYVMKMYTWLYICAKYAHKTCGEEMLINIFLTPFKKTLPINKTTMLSGEHVNTAFTIWCVPDGEITIFREEEWFKVFIHETFHSYGLDFALYNSNHLLKVLEKTFPIKSEFNANEAYAETWARIINCVFYSFYSLDNKNDIQTFLLYAEFCLQLERIFSICQVNKILNYMGLNYEDLYSSREKSVYLRQQLYKENTHVFCYYILTAVFFNNYIKFMNWCGENNVGTNNVGTNNVGTNNVGTNNSFMKFTCNEQNIKNIADYIINVYKNDEFIKTINAVKKIGCNDMGNTTRMTIINI
jgi:hypothetical protein